VLRQLLLLLPVCFRNTNGGAIGQDKADSDSSIRQHLSRP